MVLKDWLFSIRHSMKFGAPVKYRRASRRRKKHTFQYIASIEKLEQRQMLSGTNAAPDFDDASIGYWWNAAEDTPVGSVIGTVSATDPDGDSFSYALTSGTDVFSIDASTGAVTLIVALDVPPSMTPVTRLSV